MDERRKTPATPPPFEHWVNIATKGLCAEAKNRIWDEVDAHCTEAEEAYEAEGFSEAEAERLAVEGLGDPKKAQRAFRKTYLTAQEARLVDRPANPFLQALAVVFTALQALWLPTIWTSFANGPLWKALGLTGAVTAYGCAGLSWFFFERGTGRRQRALCYCLGVASLALAYCSSALCSDVLQPFPFFFWLPGALFALHAIQSFFSLWRKLGNEENKA